ncbi:hypothetical protein AI2710V1_0559 [Enterobacter cloacae]|nr:hypothetical protein AI2710V1_0559 [Enterobacter cloacae]CAH3356458.1 hypothetical protein AI2710V1_0559 [Enterobacter cloacae]CAH5611931.1 hypothetical protein AI2941V1_1826 [Enterobacter cloacae]
MIISHPNIKSVMVFYAMLEERGFIISISNGGNNTINFFTWRG